MDGDRSGGRWHARAVMHAPLALFLATLVAASSGCGEKKDQSFAEGMQLLCGSTASLPSTMSKSEKATAIARTADEKVTNEEVRQLARSLAALPGDQKLVRLRAAAARAKIDRCGLVELWTESPTAQALRTICEAPGRVPEAGGDPSARAQAIADYIKANVTDPDALALMQELATEEPGARTAHLASVARDNGIERCPLAEMK